MFWQSSPLQQQKAKFWIVRRDVLLILRFLDWKSKEEGKAVHAKTVGFQKAIEILRTQLEELHEESSMIG